MELVEVLLGFAASAAVVVAAGVALARSGDVIAARTRLGGLWVGSMFLAVATSLPELTTDLAAIRLGVPDLAVGDLFGSSMANMLILALVSLLPGVEVFRRAALDNALLIALAILLTVLAAAVLLTEPRAAVLGVGPGSLLLLAVYVGGTRLIFHQSALLQQAGAETEMAGAAPGATGGAKQVPTLRRAIVTFVVGALVVLVAGPFFAASANALAERTGVEASFVGTWLVGFSTSLPELVTSIAAVRLGAYDLAVGNLYGSNAFNMLLILPLDAAHGSGPILGAVAPVHAISALVAVALMSIGLAAVVYRARGRFSMLEPSGAMMVVGYVVGLVVIYLASG